MVKRDQESIGAAVGRIPSGCAILTATHAGRSTGLLVSWVQQAAFEPMALSVCVKRGRPVEELIEGSSRFLINILGHHPAAMFKHFGKGFSLEEDAFAGLDIRTTEYGPLIESCIAHLGCSVMNKVPAGDHNLYIASVEAAGVVDGAAPYTHVRKSGYSY